MLKKTVKYVQHCILCASKLRVLWYQGILLDMKLTRRGFYKYGTSLSFGDSVAWLMRTPLV